MVRSTIETSSHRSRENYPLGSLVLNKKAVRMKFDKYVIISTQLRDTDKFLRYLGCMEYILRR